MTRNLYRNLVIEFYARNASSVLAITHRHWPDRAYSSQPDTTRLVELKIARLDPENYAFWSEYEIMNRTRGIMFVPVFTNLHGNIEGGYGNFTGMGSSIYPISLTKDSLYQYE